MTIAASLAAAPVAGLVAQSSQNSSSQGAQVGPTAQRQPKPGSLTVPISASVVSQDAANPGQTMNGTLTIQRFAQLSTGIAAVGTLTLNVEGETTATADATTTSTQSIVTQIGLPVSRQAASQPTTPTTNTSGSGSATSQTTLTTPTTQVAACSAVQLALGAADVTINGRQLRVNSVSLDVAATPGSSTRLSTLLCALSTQLGDTTGQLTAGDASDATRVVTLLNQLLDLLG